MITGNEYSRIHYAARKKIARQCEACGSSGQMHAALRVNANPDHLKQDEISGCWYSTDINDYMPLCIPCHRKQDRIDGRPLCKHGHAYTPENTHIKADGSRQCRTCNREQAAARLRNEQAKAKKKISDRHYRQSHPMTESQKARKLELQRIRREAARQARFEKR